MIEQPPFEVIRATYPELVRFLTGLGQIRVPRGTQVTSWYRDPYHNRQVGGAATSQHLLGLAIDLVVPAEGVGSIVQQARRAGLVPVVESDHVHLQARPAGTSGALLAAIGLG